MSKILFIHPDVKLIDIYRRHLGQSFYVDSAHDGLSGLRKIKSFNPRLIVSDYELEHLSGLALLQFVRRHPQMFATPFIFLTHSNMPHEALELGASGWVNQKEQQGVENLLAHIYQHKKVFQE